MEHNLDPLDRSRRNLLIAEIPADKLNPIAQVRQVPFVPCREVVQDTDPIATLDQCLHEV
jgi:hypothetical protein